MKDSDPRMCFCVSLRPALLLISYIRLLICLIAVSQFTLLCIDLYRRLHDSYEDAIMFIECAASIIPQLVDLVFTLIFIIAAHKRNIHLQEMFYYYCITMTMLYLLVVILIACNMERFEMLYYMIFTIYTLFMEPGYYQNIAFGVTTTVLQVYMTFVVRCELKNQRHRVRAELARQRSRISFRGIPKINNIIP